jgi:Zn finger protein HypA/HybF involved in hydrogenase expression
MHELSVALEICRMVEERLTPAESPQLRQVCVIVGDDSGLEPANLSFCLDALLSQPPFGSAHTVLTRCPGDTLRVDYFEVDDGNPDD